VDECGGRQRLAGRLVAELPLGELPKFVVDERQEGASGLRFAFAEVLEDLGDFAGGFVVKHVDHSGRLAAFLVL
jgi:hypothetical protein